MIKNETTAPAETKENKKSLFTRVSNRIDRFDDKHPLVVSLTMGMAATAIIGPAFIYVNNKIEAHFDNSTETTKD